MGPAFFFLAGELYTGAVFLGIKQWSTRRYKDTGQGTLSSSQIYHICLFVLQLSFLSIWDDRQACRPAESSGYTYVA